MIKHNKTWCRTQKKTNLY